VIPAVGPMPQSREQKLASLRARQHASVLVVGGGINGISVFRELALQGVDVVLAERGDFMCGASAAPSRMIHGGLRYMENGEFDLVKESLRERNRLLLNAPHYVFPLPTLIPLTDRFSGLGAALWRLLGGPSRSGPRGSLVVRIGLTLYDLYARGKGALPRHRFFRRNAIRARWPGLSPCVAGGALYYDAKITYPERLGIEMVLDTEAAMPQALAINHLGLAGLEDGTARLIDRLTGAEVSLKPQIIVNATGAWVDLTNGLLARKPERLIGGTKGSHLVIDHPALTKALGDSMIYFANRDGRVCILFVHLGHALAGSTDISVETPDGIRCDAGETAYILESVRQVFPDIAIDERHIIFSFSGVRPLPRSDAEATGEISRDHSCEWLADGAGASLPVLNLIGGKWTTFRAFGAEAADQVLARLGLRKRVATENMAIGGGRDFPVAPAAKAAWIADIAARTGLAPDRVAGLLARYGTRATAMAAFMAEAADCALASLPAYSRREIEFLLRNEHVATLADLVLRRLAIALSGELSLSAVHELGAIAGHALEWDDIRVGREIDDLLAQLAQMHGVTAEMLHRRNREGTHVPEQKGPPEPAVRQRQVP
jgi:glycerol-3-phosphate dehydrogenase